MRRFYFAFMILFSPLAPGLAHAQEALVTGPKVTVPKSAEGKPQIPDPKIADSKTQDPKAIQDQLFETLRRERDPERAKEIAGQIMANWGVSGSATVDYLMQLANKSIADKNNSAALDFLDEVTALNPNYTEGWNRRATLHYTMGNMRKSMADINQVLQRDPRHFPAIAGMATILMENGEDELALKAWERFLTIYPAERDAQQNVTRLSEKLAGSRT